MTRNNYSIKKKTTVLLINLYVCVSQTTLGKAFSPVYLVAPVQIMTWLNQYHDYCEEILNHIKYVYTKMCKDNMNSTFAPRECLFVCFQYGNHGNLLKKFSIFLKVLAVWRCIRNEQFLFIFRCVCYFTLVLRSGLCSSLIPNRYLIDGAEVPNQRTKSFIQAVLKTNNLEKVCCCFNIEPINIKGVAVF